MTACPQTTVPSSPSLFQNGNIVFQAHHVGWIVATTFTIAATVTSFWLVNKHLQWYTKKREQRYIVRILFMVPIYAIISLASYFFWNHATPLLLIRDAYESTVLTSFFYLLLLYLSPDPNEQRIIFSKAGLSREADREALRKDEEPKKWVFPLGFIKWKPADGLLFLQAMKWGVLQYCVIRPTTTLAAVILDYIGLYCEDSWGLGWGHIYITIIVSLSVTVAMYCLIQLYVPVSTLLAPRKPLLKLFAIKAVVFLTFWQSTFLSLLSMLGVVKDTKYMTADDINIGIGALLETFEMMLFAFLHIKAFSYKPYRPIQHPGSKDPLPSRTPRLRSLAHAFDFRETFRELWQGCVYLYDKMRGRQPKVDLGARQATHYEAAFGKSRPSHMMHGTTPLQPVQRSYRGKDLPVPPNDGQERFPNSERQWLGIGDDYGYGLHREKSDGLEAAIENELIRRGYDSGIPGRGHIKPIHKEETIVAHPRQRSWWHAIYNRISHSGAEVEREFSPRLSQKRFQSKTRQDIDVTQGLRGDYRPVGEAEDPQSSPPVHSYHMYHPVLYDPELTLDSPPPPSLLLTPISKDVRLFDGGSSVGMGTPTQIDPVSGLELGLGGEYIDFQSEPQSQTGIPTSRVSVDIIEPSSLTSHMHRREFAFYGTSYRGLSRASNPDNPRTSQPSESSAKLLSQNAPTDLAHRSRGAPRKSSHPSRRRRSRHNTPTSNPSPRYHVHRTKHSISNTAGPYDNASELRHTQPSAKTVYDYELKRP